MGKLFEAFREFKLKPWENMVLYGLCNVYFAEAFKSGPTNGNRPWTSLPQQ